jgi:hypothetical protein
MSSISCHLAHGGTKLHHLKMSAEIAEDGLNQNTETKDMWHKCHLILWGLGKHYWKAAEEEEEEEETASEFRSIAGTWSEGDVAPCQTATAERARV